MAADKLIGHFASSGAYIIFGLNIVICKDIANSGMISPIAMFASGAAIATGIDIINWQKIVATVLIFSGVALVNRSRARVSDKS